MIKLQDILLEAVALDRIDVLIKTSKDINKTLTNQIVTCFESNIHTHNFYKFEV